VGAPDLPVVAGAALPVGAGVGAPVFPVGAGVVPPGVAGEGAGAGVVPGGTAGAGVVPGAAGGVAPGAAGGVPGAVPAGGVPAGVVAGVVPAGASGPFDMRMWNSTRRFFCRPSAVWLSAIGFRFPKPFDSTRFGAIPRLMR